MEPPSRSEASDEWVATRYVRGADEIDCEDIYVPKDELKAWLANLALDEETYYVVHSSRKGPRRKTSKRDQENEVNMIFLTVSGAALHQRLSNPPIFLNLATRRRQLVTCSPRRRMRRGLTPSLRR